MVTIVLKSVEEAQVLTNIINVALQVKGLEAAESALYFANLIRNAVKESEEPPK